MINGEDVIADVQEAYPEKEAYSPIGYFMKDPYQVNLHAAAEMLFEGTQETPQKINDLNLELFPWIPLSSNNATLVVLSNVATIYNPHPEVESKWKTCIKGNDTTKNNPS